MDHSLDDPEYLDLTEKIYDMHVRLLKKLSPEAAEEFKELHLAQIRREHLIARGKFKYGYRMALAMTCGALADG